ncbi:hypothetical protein P5G50_18400 [Leifsonia sp. F6_8S_P_1B]|uniref:DUF4177 domain-containing protein n=1 Tax=Leifsonia williamsii TaxID=3035919 RepID=A0ABT8KHG0_9MICO|nr:hypothetical protein [Leifsonia williamsii]MDN4616423.1 hypothetical protein [Leifsonia williamsii]
MAVKFETKTLKLKTTRGSGRDKKKGERQLAELIADGWEIVSEHRKGALEWGNKDTYILRRAKA